MQLASFGLCFEGTSDKRVAKIMMTPLECHKEKKHFVLLLAIF